MPLLDRDVYRNRTMVERPLVSRNNAASSLRVTTKRLEIIW